MTNAIRGYRGAGLAIISAAVIILAACGDDQHPSAPTRSYMTGRSADVGNAGLSQQTVGTPNAKPQDQVGFTQVSVLHTGNVTAPAGQTTSGSKDCPAGSIAISGGYTLFTTAGATPPLVTWTGPSGPSLNPTAWEVTVSNEAAGSGPAIFEVFVLCVS